MRTRFGRSTYWNFNGLVFLQATTASLHLAARHRRSFFSTTFCRHFSEIVVRGSMDAPNRRPRRLHLPGSTRQLLLGRSRRFPTSGMQLQSLVNGPEFLSVCLQYCFLLVACFRILSSIAPTTDSVFYVHDAKHCLKYVSRSKGKTFSCVFKYLQDTDSLFQSRTCIQQ